jgi:hypothetical protein
MEPNKQSTLQPHPAKEPRKPASSDPHAGIDLEVSRRPGYSRERGIKSWPNSRWPIEPQRRDVTVFMHGRSNKTFPPVFGTDVPPKGLAGLIRKLAYQYPDHMARHWLMLLAADRVDAWGFQGKKLLPLVVPVVVVGVVARRLSRRF